MAPWWSGYHYCTTSFNWVWTQVLRRLKPCSRRVGDSRWWGSLTMVPAGNKAEHLSPFVTFHKNNSSLSSSANAFFWRPPPPPPAPGSLMIHQMFNHKHEEIATGYYAVPFHHAKDYFATHIKSWPLAHAHNTFKS